LTTITANKLIENACTRARDALKVDRFLKNFFMKLCSKQKS